jgi:hypothetical protein
MSGDYKSLKSTQKSCDSSLIGDDVGRLCSLDQ